MVGPLLISLWVNENGLQEALTRLLESAGFRVVLYHSGDTGLKKTTQTLPAAIIVDEKLEDMSGQMAAVLASRDRLLKTVPLLFLSSRPNIVGQVKLEYPSPYWIEKPFKPEQILEKLTLMIQSFG